mmetsp:Transcript_5289/g.4481  ORF Transcript_5289/g.4481 Transcript_5289/m.4481 type:complete len:148 (+) Transcript_5289:1269-1712(+)|eukprot:CAMPEP_0114601858 /NCGR_PEP_ID=MMETSP0125-20121206/24477_1 /TAXON_ID=485358 ORGANISM="Aristerostoma sp., Strain ATCC 50986" /NCGR_SAMPLE_ID=MMETSP0125 /ASSEMBLY_ACC=CAM_ASM_000245 /LENGTH=147 /DNA_ID=CAMNT_0001811507 /DNA_START=1158 /DNA_END=1601 /DNA_ORIENTATION=-
MNVDIVIKEKSADSDLDKISYVGHGERKLYQLSFEKVDFNSIVNHPLTFEKFNSELKFYLSASLKIDPNLIRVVRIRKNVLNNNVIVDIDIRDRKTTINDIRATKEKLEKRFSTVLTQEIDYLQKLNLSLEDFDFTFNMTYAGYQEA